MNPQQKFDAIRLARSKNIGSKTFFELIDQFLCPSLAINHINQFDNRKFQISSIVEIENEIEKTEKFGAKIITIFDDEYPLLLKEIPDPPPVITIKGRVDLLKKRCFAVVGARNASYNGLIFAKKIASDIVKHDFVIVSGLARGVDKVAHEVSVNCGTIAVIAGGISNIYPQENRSLYEKIFTNGLIISEQPFASAPLAKNFVQRNRIISGISIGVLLIEAGMKSGSLTTANFAAEQGRCVFAVPGAPYDPKSLGCNKIIKDGAKMTENINDIIEEFDLFLNNNSSKNSEDFISDNKEIKANDLQSKILSLLNYDVEVPIDYIIEKLNIDVAQIKICLTELELEQRIFINNNMVILAIE